MQIRHILVPVDFGEASAEATELACSLAAKFAAKLTLLHSLFVSPLAYVQDSMSWVAEWATASRAELDALTAATRRRHLDTEALFMEGDPKLSIVEAARDRSIDLIVAGTHGRRGISKLLFGSVAVRLVRSSPVPLITTPALPQRIASGARFRHILVATDFGEPAQRARFLACELALRFDASVTLLHTVPSVTPQLARTLPGEAAIVAAGKRALEAELELTKVTASKVDSRLAEGDPREQILRVAEDCKADLIAMGTHARRGLPRFFLGSTAEAVVRDSPIPVLTTSCEG